jgi:peptide-methionine (R)-S-oxide reductase
MEKVKKSEQEWREQLSPEQYAVLRESATERPGTGALLHNKTDGTYRCAACGNELFDSDTKYESHSGWPSFYDAKPGAVEFVDDSSHGMVRIEARCGRCESHLGHVFDDGPNPTGMRYCMNSLALSFDEGDDAA